MIAGACNMATDEYVPIHLSDLFDLLEVTGYVLGQRKSTPRHPAREDNIDHHQHSLRWCVDKNISWFVRIAVVGKLKHLLSDTESVLVRARHRRQRPVGI